ncbi:CWF19-like protein 2 [Lates japonicus]|uniref:CWF19-like protein 2 n=1 Tax=Lates japonicus TaxID=270547 RepID=A0AAD3MLM2_LATJO|nr:CWF19-like protein 2 [Lates japonicus]
MMMGKTDGDNYTLDDMFVSSAAQREGEGREEERMRSRAIGESRRLAASMGEMPALLQQPRAPEAPHSGNREQGVPEPARGIVHDRGPLSHLSSPASLLCHRIGRGHLVRNAAVPACFGAYV